MMINSVHNPQDNTVQPMSPVEYEFAGWTSLNRQQVFILSAIVV
jgi:hypothetical protein